MSTDPDPRREGRAEGESRKEAAHALLEAHREFFIRRARRALLEALLCTGTATADDVAELVGPAPGNLDPRFLGTVPGPLAQAGIIRPAGYEKSCRPSRHASILTVWELADRAAALAWLARHPGLPEPDDDDEAGEPCPDASTPTPKPSATHQTTMF